MQGCSGHRENSLPRPRPSHVPTGLYLASGGPVYQWRTLRIKPIIVKFSGDIFPTEKHHSVFSGISSRHYAGHAICICLLSLWNCNCPGALRKVKVRKARTSEGHFLQEAKPGCKKATSQTVAVIRQIHLHSGKSNCSPALNGRCKWLCDLDLSGSATAVHASSWDSHF